MDWRFWERWKEPSEETCRAIAPLLALYADEAAAARETIRVKAHLAGCASCRRSYQWLLETRATLAARPAALPPLDLRLRVARAIAASSATPAFATLTPPLRRSFVLRPAFAAAASVALFGAVSLAVFQWTLHPDAATPVRPPIMAMLPKHAPVTSGPTREALRPPAARILPAMPLHHPWIAHKDETANAAFVADFPKPMVKAKRPVSRLLLMAQVAPLLPDMRQLAPKLPVKNSSTNDRLALLPPSPAPGLSAPESIQPNAVPVTPRSSVPAAGSAAPPPVRVAENLQPVSKHSGEPGILDDVKERVNELNAATYTPKVSADRGSLHTVAFVQAAGIYSP